MTDGGDVRKRILFISCALGIAAGITAYLAYKATLTENFALLAVVPAVLVTCIPMVNALRRLLVQQRKGNNVRDAA